MSDVPAPGWHPDPWGTAPLRWWDGAGWTHWAAMPGMAPWADPAVATVDISTIDPATAPPAPPADGRLGAPVLAPSPSEPPAPSGPSPSGAGEIKPGKQVARLVADGKTALALLSDAALVADHRQAEAARALIRLREVAAQETLAAIPVGSLRQTAGGGLRVTALEEAGVRSVADVLRAGPAGLVRADGVGETTAARVMAAATAAAERARAEARIQLDAAAPTPDSTALVIGLLRWADARAFAEVHGPAVAALATELRGLTDAAQPATSRIGMWFRGDARRVALGAAASLAHRLADPAVRALLQASHQTLSAPAPDPGSAWTAYASRAADLQALLELLGAGGPTTEGRTGHVPAEIIAAVEALTLDTSLLDPGLTLRGYQDFGARFALVQRRTILGDEMGLGKTIQALAAMAHLVAAEGATHLAVICPAAVVVNWAREIAARSQLTPLVAHGAERDAAVERWQGAGGVLVTTYDTARRLPAGVFGAGPEIGLLVVDECHYVKNPEAQRTQAVRGWAAASERVLYMSGTPMENRVSEFRELVSHLQPELAQTLRVDDGLLGADAFRRAVAPVYLRRNQTDVLTELPARIDHDAWVEMVGADLAAYRQEVASGSFMGMRRAAFAPGTVEGSAKLDALVDICDEAADEGLKVVVFSFFRDVLDAAVAVLGERAVGPVTGDVAPAARQELVDRFTAADGHAVLVGQIEASGVGLNIQAGSVVILCEPQWKPSTEEQAIARCHRMGQARRVQVHRLLASDSVDEHMRQLVRSKAELVEAHVGTSATAEASPAATDPSSDPPIDVASAEREIVTAERTRLGVEPPPDGGVPPVEAPDAPGAGAPTSSPTDPYAPEP